MYGNNGFSELAKLMFKNSGDDETLKQLLNANYSEADYQEEQQHSEV